MTNLLRSRTTYYTADLGDGTVMGVTFECVYTSTSRGVKRVVGDDERGVGGAQGGGGRGSIGKYSLACRLAWPSSSIYLPSSPSRYCPHPPLSALLLARPRYLH